MLRGLYTAATGMMTESMRTDVISNNIANVNTTGYKKDETISREFETLLLKRVNDGQGVPEDIGTLGRGSMVEEIATIHDQGSFRDTGGTYDLSIEGRGYFVIETPQGQRYTRDGSFARSANGELVNMDGARVLDQGGRPIYIPDGRNVTIGANGAIEVDEEPVGTIGIVDFADRRALLKAGGNLFVPQEGQQPTAAAGAVKQGQLEVSNVNVVSEMVKLINAYRAYESNSKAVVSQDRLLDKAVNEVGRG